jgi:hypothetical protein
VLRGLGGKGLAQHLDGVARPGGGRERQRVGERTADGILEVGGLDAQPLGEVGDGPVGRLTGARLQP